MTRRKRIVIDGRIRETSTGRYADRLIEHLQSADTAHDYIILLRPGDTWRPSSPVFKTLPCPIAQFSLNPVDQFRFAWQLYKLRPSLVHFTMTQQPLLYFGRIVTTTHDLTMFRFVRRGSTSPAVFRLKMMLYRLLFRWSHAKSTKIIVPSRYVANDLANYQPSTKSKTVVIYEAGDMLRSQKEERPAQIAADSRFILYVGTAFPHKNLDRLIAAFDVLHARDPALKLVLVGKKELHYERLEKRRKAHPAADNILITGFLPDEQLAWLYRHCLSYVFPSLSEGFGLPGLEAMAYGAPVVASNATCLPEVYGNAAHYFNAADPKDIASKVGEVLYDSKLRETLVAHGMQQLKHYSWQRMAHETLAVYTDLLNR